MQRRYFLVSFFIQDLLLDDVLMHGTCNAGILISPMRFLKFFILTKKDLGGAGSHR